MKQNLMVRWGWPIFFGLSAASGVYFWVQLARLPSDGGAGLLGLSLRRLALLAPMGLLIIGLAVLGWISARKKWQGQAGWLPAMLLLAAGLIVLPQVGLDLLNHLFQGSGAYVYAAYAARLAPVAHWFFGVGLLLAALVLTVWRKDLLRGLGGEAGAFRRWGWLWLLLLVPVGVVTLGRVGLTEDKGGAWGLPTVPLLEWQIGLALCITVIFVLLLGHTPASKRADLLISLAIWAAAAALWAGKPLVPGYFATPGRAPNFEPYPFSDGATYDQFAQSVLTGNGFMGSTIPHRPLYITFLTLLHVLAGQDYLKVIFLQTLVLAIFPVLLYWIGKELHSRPAGVLAALLVIFRELTAIRAAPFTDNISYSKLYFSELPTAICLSAFSLFAIRWMKQGARKQSARWPYAPLIAGGCVGMAMLIRTQSLSAMALALLAGLFAFRRDWGGWLRGALLMGLGVLVCILPWFGRNYPIAGGPAFDNTETQTMVLAQRYNNIPFEQPIPRLPGETESHFAGRLMQMAAAGMSRDPGGSAWAIVNHFVNNEIGNLLLFPLRFTISGADELIWPRSAFWQAWNGSLTFAQGWLILINLGLLAAGLAGAAGRVGSAAWVPLLVNLGYNFSTAVFRSSGGRFLLPVDWAFVLLYAVGWAQVLAWVWRDGAAASLPRMLPEAIPPGETAAAGRQASVLRLAGIGLAFLLVGSSLPLVEHAFPERYADETRDQLATDFINAAGNSAGALKNLVEQPGTILLRGRALYPRYYRQGEMEPKTAKPGYAGTKIPRLVFYLVGRQNGLVVLPLDLPPDRFPNTADVLVAGCQEQGYLRAIGVIVQSGNDLVYQAASPGCGAQK